MEALLARERVGVPLRSTTLDAVQRQAARIVAEGECQRRQVAVATGKDAGLEADEPAERAGRSRCFLPWSRGSETGESGEECGEETAERWAEAAAWAEVVRSDMICAPPRAL